MTGTGWRMASIFFGIAAAVLAIGVSATWVLETDFSYASTGLRRATYLFQAIALIAASVMSLRERTSRMIMWSLWAMVVGNFCLIALVVFQSSRGSGLTLGKPWVVDGPVTMLLIVLAALNTVRVFSATKSSSSR